MSIPMAFRRVSCGVAKQRAACARMGAMIGGSGLGLNDRPATHILPWVEQGRHIPKIIHQTYPTQTLPEAFQKNQDSLKQNNPDWVYRLYDDAEIEQFIQASYGAVILGYYRRINPKYGSARADLFRYLLMYQKGGVYLDIKSTLQKPLADLLHPDDAYLLATWRNRTGEEHENYGIWKDLRHVPDGEFQQWHIIAVAGHPFLRAVIDAVLTNIDRYHPCLHGVGRAGVIRVTGPVAYTRAIYPLLDQYSHRLLRGEDKFGLSYSVLGKLAHTTYFKSHYLILTETVIELEGVGRIFAKLYNYALDAKNWARRTAKAILLAPSGGKLSIHNAR